VRPIATIDTSCVIALDFLNLLPLTANLFHRLLLPKAVRAELFDRRDTKVRVRNMLRDYAFLERCDDFDKAAIDLLLAGPQKRGRGEAEAVVQAASVGAMVIVDDPWGREIAANYRLEHHGTLWIIHRLHELQYIDSLTVREYLLTLVENGIRLPIKAVNRLLQELGEPPIIS
jgi:predicted nucleic acid-binding protein